MKVEFLLERANSLRSGENREKQHESKVFHLVSMYSVEGEPIRRMQANVAFDISTLRQG